MIHTSPSSRFCAFDRLSSAPGRSLVVLDVGGWIRARAKGEEEGWGDGVSDEGWLCDTCSTPSSSSCSSYRMCGRMPPRTVRKRASQAGSSTPFPSFRGRRFCSTTPGADAESCDICDSPSNHPTRASQPRSKSDIKMALSPSLSPSQSLKPRPSILSRPLCSPRDRFISHTRQLPRSRDQTSRMKEARKKMENLASLSLLS